MTGETGKIDDVHKSGRIVFNTSVLGASHIKDDKPCQDYSIAWQSEDSDEVVLIVCDGHGSDTYVRSEVGSRLACEITLKAVQEFFPKDGKELDLDWIIDTKGAVTAREVNESLRYSDIPSKDESEMTESEMLRFKQRLEFIEQIKGLHEQDAIFQALFTSRYEKWLDAINKDAEQNPFSEEELSKLGNHKLVKAYGTTLMAYVQTSHYWFAFHIGDGRMLACFDGAEWAQIVPWDCSCFQNQTTSLCNSYPVPYFRYSFDGTGSFPIAVFCCSDGIEDSYGDYEVAPERLQGYFAGLTKVFVEEGKECTMARLEEFLPKLSSVGSKDDMSLAGLIDVDTYMSINEQEEIIENQEAQ